MIARRKLYAVHRWLGLVVSLQLLAWSTGGLLFSVMPIDEVRGKQDMSTREPVPLDAAALRTTTAEAVRVAKARWSEAQITELVVREQRGRFIYEARDEHGEAVGRIDATTGEALSAVTPDEASSVAARDFAPEGEVVEVVRIGDSPPLEYRSKPLPAYRVTIDHPKRPHIYVSETNGEVTARRNARWRVFDFFWMLHIMDYDDREDFNHPVLTIFSALAVLSALSGLVLHSARALSRRRRGRAS